MRQNHIVVTRREGQTIYYRVSNDKVIEACHLMKEVTMVLLDQSRELSSMLEG